MALYAFLSQILPYGDSDMERLFVFGRTLLPHLRPDREQEAINIAGTVELEYYRLEEVSTNAIRLGEDGNGQVKGPTAIGTGEADEDEAPFSEIIKRVNARFGTNFTERDGLFLRQVEQDALNIEDIRQTALANPFEKFSLSIRQQLPQLLIERMAGNDTLVTKCLNDPQFQEAIFTDLLRRIFETITNPTPLMGNPDADFCYPTSK